MAALGHSNQANPAKKFRTGNIGSSSSGDDVNSINLNPTFPEDVLMDIFSFLPIKHAVQASTVSKKFKHAWFCSRILCFDKEFARRHDQKDFMDIVNHVFAHHKGPNIQTFSLFFDPTGIDHVVENWIRASIDKGVEVLDLNFTLATIPYKITTTDFADNRTIKILKLYRCELNLVPTFRGLNSLTIIVLKKMDVKSKSIEILLANCLYLETLELIKCRKIGRLKILAHNLTRFKALKLGDCFGIGRITIDAPTMQSMYYSGIFILFKFGEISQLEDVSLNFKPIVGMEKFFRRDDFLCDLSHVPILSISTTFLEDLTPAFFRRRTMRFYFWNLRELQLFMDNDVHCNLYHISNFLKKCPLLEKLFIDLQGFIFEDRDTWKYHKEIVERDNAHFSHLQYVKMEGFKYDELELEMVRYLLDNASILKTIVLVRHKVQDISHGGGTRQPIQILPVSPTAKVFLIDPEDDESLGAMHSRTWFEV